MSPLAPRLGVLGGTFDPPHLAHLAMGAAAKQALDLERVIFLPAGDPWRKAERGVTPGPQRLRMLEAAVEPFEWAQVSTIEMDRPGPSYIVETLPLLMAAERDQAQWWFILGNDALEDLPAWHEPERLLDLARLALVRRAIGEAVPVAVREQFPSIEERIDIVAMEPLAVSSTDIRVRVREGRSTSTLLPEAVRAIVDELELYRGDGTS